jgi:hypothetical protein
MNSINSKKKIYSVLPKYIKTHYKKYTTCIISLLIVGIEIKLGSP